MTDGADAHKSSEPPTGLELTWAHALELDQENDLKGARALYEQVVEGKTSQLGASDLSTLAAKLKLGIVLDKLGLEDEGRELCREVIAGRTAALGPEHAETVTAKLSLAILLRWTVTNVSLQNVKGDVDVVARAESRRLYEEIVADRTKALGPRHFLTLSAKAELADVVYCCFYEPTPSPCARLSLYTASS